MFSVRGWPLATTIDARSRESAGKKKERERGEKKRGVAAVDYPAV